MIFDGLFDHLSLSCACIFFWLLYRSYYVLSFHVQSFLFSFFRKSARVNHYESLAELHPVYIHHFSLRPFNVCEYFLTRALPKRCIRMDKALSSRIRQEQNLMEGRPNCAFCIVVFSPNTYCSLLKKQRPKYVMPQVVRYNEAAI